MIDWLVNQLFKWGRLRNAIFDEVHLYDQLDETLKEMDREDYRSTNLSWSEDDGLWRGWIFNQKHNRYLFDDTGHESFSDLLQTTWLWDSEMNGVYN